MRKAAHHENRRGSITLYALIVLFILLAMASFAVDYAVVQIAKTQLTAVVDAAARCAAKKLATGSTTAQAQSAAITLAAQNKVNGAALTLTTANVVVGNWDSSAQTFTANGTPTNACRVTGALSTATGNPVQLYWARVIGRSTCDVHASATATFKSSGYGLVGLNFIKMSGNASDSYWDTTGVTGGQNGSIASNGDITLSGSASINGDAHPGIGKSVSKPGAVTGSTAALTAPLVYPPGSAGSYATTNDDGVIPVGGNCGILNGSLNLSGNNSLTLPGGNYYFNNYTTSGNSTVTFTGPATLYIYGKLDISGCTVTYSNQPTNLKIVMVPDSSGNAPGSVTISGSSAMYADIYAPQSPLTISGTGDLYGSIVGLSIDMSGTAKIHYDILNDPNAGKVVMAQ
jgi:Flp pilus assembly protein TadG